MTTKINSIVTIVMLSAAPFFALAGTGISAPQSQEDHHGIEQNERYNDWAAFLHQQMLDFTYEENIPNAVIALVSDNRIHLLQGYGYSDMEDQIAVNPEKHLFRTGSVSKIFTWAAIMQLYEQGLVDLNADINVYLDIELNHRILYKTTHPEPITLNHLISHTAGYEDVLEGLFGFRSLPSLRQQLLQKIPSRIYPPGTVMAYSNYGTSLAGYIVEQVSGMPFEEYVKENIFIPLGMNGSSFKQPLPDMLQANMVNSYRWVNGAFLQGNFEYIPAPAGGLSTTAYDMALFIQANLNGGINDFGNFLQPETIEKMHSSHFSYHPLTAGMTYGLMESNINDQRIISHGGSSSVFDAGFYLLPDHSSGLFIAYSGGDYTGSINILRNFLDEFFPFTYSPSEDISPLMPVKLSDLKGEYHQSRTMRSSSERIMNLLIGSLHLTPTSKETLEFSLYNMDFSYEEVIPGIYRSKKVNRGYPFGSMDYILAATAPDGRLMLVTDGPMSFIKARWWESALFAILLFVPAIMLALGSLLFFTGRMIYRVLHKSTRPFKGHPAVFNRLIVAHAISLIAFVLFFGANSAPHPVHLLPGSFFDPDPLMNLLIKSAIFLASVLGLILVYFTVRGLKIGTVPIRVKVYQSVYAFLAIGLVWLFWFYNMLI